MVFHELFKMMTMKMRLRHHDDPSDAMNCEETPSVSLAIDIELPIRSGRTKKLEVNPALGGDAERQKCACLKNAKNTSEG